MDNIVTFPGRAAKRHRRAPYGSRASEPPKNMHTYAKPLTHRAVLTDAWVIEELIAVVIEARTQDRPDSAGANKALHLLGLHLGMFIEKKETGKPGEFNGLTIASKRERVLGIAKRLGIVRGRAVEGRPCFDT
jgi:hypothetical protein